MGIKTGIIVNFYMLVCKVFHFTQTIYHIDNIFCHHQKSFMISYNVFILFKAVFYLKLNLKLKLDPKTRKFKTWKKLAK